MNDKTFLMYAAQQSFRQPLITGDDIKIVRSGAKSDFVFHNISGYKMQPAYFPAAQFHKIAKIAQKCIISTESFQTEYQILKHNLSENIFVPTDKIEAQNFQKKLQLSTLSRSAAQKKKVLATVISGNFADQFSNSLPVYQKTLQQLQVIEKAYPTAVECSQLGEFASAYRQAMKGFRFSNFMFAINKKRFLSYLCEAIQILRFQPKLPDDYLETRTFIGENTYGVLTLSRLCRSRLQYLLAVLETMAQKDDLLQNTQKLIACPKEYRKIIQQYRTTHAPQHLQEISLLRQNAKKIFRQYAFLTYLNGVRTAFEYKLDDAPIQKQPPLPTVAPNEELKKIFALVMESAKTTACGKLNGVYRDALKQFEQTLAETQKIFATLKDEKNNIA